MHGEIIIVLLTVKMWQEFNVLSKKIKYDYSVLYVGYVERHLRLLLGDLVYLVIPRGLTTGI